MLLKEVYPALTSLAHARYSSPQEAGLLQEALDRLMREGILAGYAQAGEKVKIADFLTRQMGALVNEMGIGLVRYLKVYCAF